MGTASSGLPMRSGIRHIGQESVGWAIGFSILLIVLGLAALALPLLAGVAIEAVFAWLLIFGGIAHLVLAFHVRGAGAHVWEALIGVAYIAFGVFLFFHPVAGLVTLTMILGAYLFVKGILELIAGFTVRGVTGGGWLFVNAILSIILAVIIWSHILSAAAWAIGTLLGIAILFSGLSRLALALAAKRTHAALV